MVKCSFTSVWDTGDVVTTDCEYNSETGLCEPEVSKAEPPTGSLDREYITLEGGEEIEVCQDCHEYVLKPTMGDRSDCSYGEMAECRNEEVKAHRRTSLGGIGGPFWVRRQTHSCADQAVEIAGR